MRFLKPWALKYISLEVNVLKNKSFEVKKFVASRDCIIIDYSFPSE